MIPWGDNVDIAIQEKHSFGLRLAIQRASKNLHMAEIIGFDKIYFDAYSLQNQKVYKLANYTWYWPFLDIWYFTKRPGEMGKCRGLNDFTCNIVTRYPLKYIQEFTKLCV